MNLAPCSSSQAARTHLCRMWPSLRLKVRRSPTLPLVLSALRNTLAMHVVASAPARALTCCFSCCCGGGCTQKRHSWPGWGRRMTHNHVVPPANVMGDGREGQQRRVVHLQLQSAAWASRLLEGCQHQPVPAACHQACSMGRE